MSHHNPSSMSDLPWHITVDILSRLPLKTIIHCRCVCKTWLNLLLHPRFVELHLSRSPPALITNATGPQCAHLGEDVLRLIDLEDEPDHHAFHLDPVMKFDIKSHFPNSNVVLVNSLHGLLCFWEMLSNSEDTIDNICICNPITGEYVKLPEPRYVRRGYSLMSYGLGYGSGSGEYKVVRIIQGQASDTPTGPPSDMFECEVYTMGTGGRWRSKGRIPFISVAWFGVYLDGGLHWPALEGQRLELWPNCFTGDRDYSIRAFDIDEEAFRIVPAPPIRHDSCVSLGVLKGCLCLCEHVPESSPDVVVWVMKQYGVKDSWVKQFVILKNFDVFWPEWELVCALKAFEDGNILILHEKVGLYSYDPERKTIRKSTIPLCSTVDHEVMLHVPGFLSLKNFVGEMVYTFR